MANLIFETHSTSLDNEAGVASGWFDVALSTAGEQQAQSLGERRRDEDLAAIFCSDLTRSWRTADIAFADRSLPIIRDARLRECHYGDLTQKPALEIERRRLHHIAEPFPNGESYQQVTDRVAEWLSEVAPQFRARTMLVIGHRATFYALEHLLKGMSLRDAVAAPWTWQPGWTYRIAPPHPDQAR